MRGLMLLMMKLTEFIQHLTSEKSLWSQVSFFALTVMRLPLARLLTQPISPRCFPHRSDVLMELQSNTSHFLKTYNQSNTKVIKFIRRYIHFLTKCIHFEKKCIHFKVKCIHSENKVYPLWYQNVPLFIHF